MHIRDILTIERTLFLVSAHSKKKVLEIISETIATNVEIVNAHDIFDGLVARERLGSTAIGHGVAIPHTRLEQTDRALGCFILLKEGIDFDAEDKVAVDMVFSLIVPHDANEDHLELLASIAQIFSQDKIRTSLRKAKTKEELYQRLTSA